ncbi:MAG: RelA/SpoT domain-containing protein [Fimbriimonadaceae bacterium]|nr:RelA/SpoT domain-containing protein [Fimbriimonadaceae bacterium]
MAFVEPKFSRSQVNRAGDILIAPEKFSVEEQEWSSSVLANWRACHGYPMNTFQATLRQKLKAVDASAIVAQRLKRAPSIVLKLQRFEGMQLARMQDIGGLRAVLGSVGKVRQLEGAYRSAHFKHDLASSKNYIDEPKRDGYRSIHLIYKYRNDGADVFNGLSLELQFRTRLQHAWATAVETMGTFLGQALKSGQGESQWRRFFSVAGAALAVMEKTASVPGFETSRDRDVFEALADTEQELRVLEKLSGFAIAASKITTERGHGAYHLIVLDSLNRRVSIRPYPVSRLEQANIDYAAFEQRTKAGEPIEAVLVSAGPIDALYKAYPNYFLDTQEFVKQISAIISDVRKQGSHAKAARSTLRK